MKKKWKRLAVFLALVVIGTGNHVLFALDQKETKDSSENGVSTEAVAADAVTGTEKHQEGLVNERTTENMAASVSEKIEGKARLPEIGGGASKKTEASLKKYRQPKSPKEEYRNKNKYGTDSAGCKPGRYYNNTSWSRGDSIRRIRNSR